ncbi:YIP1 family protein [Deinococcus pimensis]|uniref:YIP1 family protein n=1 Tax=Deinococcus pimensis TaxID=309888 RepID=UPI0004834E60|nr:YIP1 family protein [Deinococcus pimensis]
MLHESDRPAILSFVRDVLLAPRRAFSALARSPRAYPFVPLGVALTVVLVLVAWVQPPGGETACSAVVGLLSALIISALLVTLVFALYPPLLVLVARPFRNPLEVHVTRRVVAWSFLPLVLLAALAVLARLVTPGAPGAAVGTSPVESALFAVANVWSVVLLVLGLARVEMRNVLNALGLLIATNVLVAVVLVLLGSLLRPLIT